MKRYSNIDVATYIAAHNLLLYHAPPPNIIFVSFKFLSTGLPFGELCGLGLKAKNIMKKDRIRSTYHDTTR